MGMCARVNKLVCVSLFNLSLVSLTHRTKKRESMIVEKDIFPSSIIDGNENKRLGIVSHCV